MLKHFYRNQIPNQGDVVIARIERVTDSAVYCQLVEFNNLEAMLPLNQISRKKIKHLGQHVKRGDTQPLLVTRVEESAEEGYAQVDLSKRQLDPEERAECLEHYHRSKKVNTMMNQLSRKCDTGLDWIYDHIAWPLYDNFTHAFWGMQQAKQDPEGVFEQLPLPEDCSPEFKDCLRQSFSSLLEDNFNQSYLVQAEVNLSCHSGKGVVVIRESLDSIQGEFPKLSVKLVASPTWVFSLQFDETESTTLDQVIQRMGEIMEKKGGKLVIKTPAKKIET